MFIIKLKLEVFRDFLLSQLSKAEAELELNMITFTK